LEDYWSGKVGLKELPRVRRINLAMSDALIKGSSDDFLSWEELFLMKEKGVFDIQSHGLFHVKHFASSKIEGFNDGSAHWSLFYATGGDIRLGIPIYEMRSTLASKRYFDDVKLREYLAGYVEKNGGKDFFQKNGWKEHLFRAVDKFCEKFKMDGKFEAREDEILKVKEELEVSKKVIEKNLGISVKYISWPWGECTEEGVKLAKIAGYEACLSLQKMPINTGSNLGFVGRLAVSSSTGIWKFKRNCYIYTRPWLAKIVKFLKEVR
jgi:hypothetical protein